MNTVATALDTDLMAATNARANCASERALVATNLTKHFGGVVALDGVSLTLEPGEVHGIIGPNGSGKTTLLNLLSGYYNPTAGTVSYLGEELGTKTVQRRASIGIARTFQKPRLLPTLSVLDNVTLGAWEHSKTGFVASLFGLPRSLREDRALRARATELLHGVGLGHAIHRRAGSLEHTEQRFVEIARGLAMRPRFILLDEPAGGLSHAEIDHLAAIIRTMQKAGIGILLVEHHTDFVFRICNRVTTLDLGQMLKHGSAEEVRNDPDVIRVYLGGD
jgi:ABC-type branched-subunit amino acid transport system ATPase component